MKFPVVLHKDSDSDYGVIFPDLPGCFSAGTTIDEAIESAKEAAECHIEGMLLDHENIPLQQSIDVHQKNPEFSGAIWGIVDVDLHKLSVKYKRVNITIPEHILKSVDQFAKKHGESRSGFLVQAATEYLNQHLSH